MFHKLTVPSVCLLVLLIASAVSGQTPAPSTDHPPAAPGSRKLTGDDARRRNELEKAIEHALKADRWDEWAIARGSELVALRTRFQGSTHFETVNAEWLLKALRRVAPMPQDDRVAYASAMTRWARAETLSEQGKSAAAQPLFQKALEIRRRLLHRRSPRNRLQLQLLAIQLNRHQLKYVSGPAAVGKARDPSAAAHRRPPLHRQPLKGLAGNLPLAGKTRPGRAAVREGP